MIQEIAPHVFKNDFHRKTPGENSCFFYFKEGFFLLRNGKIPQIPTFTDLGPLEKKACLCADYLFCIDEQDYYLIDETRLNLDEMPVHSWSPVSAIPDLRPMATSFAAANASQLWRFYHNNRYCGRCGKIMIKSKKERAMVCPSCGCTIYPKIAPAVIVAVVDASRLLLIRYAGRDYKRYALVAGYTEFGETLEETVRREVMEEVGLKVKNIRYYKNQPWAFSDSLLVGFFADLDGSPQIRLDQTELSTAIWAERDEISEDYTNVSLTHEMILLFKNTIALPL